MSNCAGRIVIKDRCVHANDVSFIESGQEDAIQKEIEKERSRHYDKFSI